MSEKQDNISEVPELDPTSSLSTNRELSFGEKAVGLAFNPGGDPAVYACKNSFAHVIDMLNTIRANAESAEQHRLCSIAITEAQGAQMWAVKAITWKD